MFKIIIFKKLICHGIDHCLDFLKIFRWNIFCIFSQRKCLKKSFFLGKLPVHQRNQSQWNEISFCKNVSRRSFLFQRFDQVICTVILHYDRNNMISVYSFGKWSDRILYISRIKNVCGDSFIGTKTFQTGNSLILALELKMLPCTIFHNKIDIFIEFLKIEDNGLCRSRRYNLPINTKIRKQLLSKELSGSF